MHILLVQTCLYDHQSFIKNIHTFHIAQLILIDVKISLVYNNNYYKIDNINKYLKSIQDI